jgi:hypothetical protein
VCPAVPISAADGTVPVAVPVAVLPVVVVGTVRGNVDVAVNVVEIVIADVADIDVAAEVRSVVLPNIGTVAVADVRAIGTRRKRRRSVSTAEIRAIAVT